MKLTVKIRRYFNSNMGRKVGGHGHIGPLKQKSQGAQAPPRPPGSDAYDYSLLGKSPSGRVLGLTGPRGQLAVSMVLEVNRPCM